MIGDRRAQEHRLDLNLGIDTLWRTSLELGFGGTRRTYRQGDDDAHISLLPTASAALELRLLEVVYWRISGEVGVRYELLRTTIWANGVDITLRSVGTEPIEELGLELQPAREEFEVELMTHSCANWAVTEPGCEVSLRLRSRPVGEGVSKTGLVITSDDP